MGSPKRKRLTKVPHYFSHKKWLVPVIVLGILTSFCSVLFPVALMHVTDSLGMKDLSLFSMKILKTVLVVMAQGVTFYFFMRFQNLYIKKNILKMRHNCYTNIMRQEYEAFDQRALSEYTAILINDVKVLEDDYFGAFIECINKIVLIILATTQLMLLDPRFIIGLFLVGGIMATLPLIFTKQIIKQREHQLKSIEKYTKFIRESLEGFETIKLFRIFGVFKRRSSLVDITMEDNNYKMKNTMAMANAIMMLTSVLLSLVTFLIGGYLVIKGSLTIGGLIAAAQLIMYVFEPVASVTQSINKINSTIPIRQKLSGIVGMTETDTEESSQMKGHIAAIKLEELYFKYSNADQMILNNINFRFTKGKKYLLVGDNGCGKSTLLKLIAGIIKPTNGTVEYIGNEQAIAYVAQKPFLFEGTIEENVVLFEKVDEKRFDDVCKKTRLDDVIKKFDTGKYYDVGYNGELLSGGERQRVAIARALYRGADVILFDEANSALDAKSVAAISEMIAQLEGILCIVITHRVDSTFQLYDHVIELDEGRIVDSLNEEIPLRLAK